MNNPGIPSNGGRRDRRATTRNGVIAEQILRDPIPRNIGVLDSMHQRCAGNEEDEIFFLNFMQEEENLDQLTKYWIKLNPHLLIDEATKKTSTRSFRSS